MTTGNATRDATLSGALSGGLLGALANIRGTTKWTQLLRPAAIGALTTGALAGGSTYVGDKLMGAPDEDEISPYTNRGMVGGVVGGGLVGGGLGALHGAGALSMPDAVPKLVRDALTKAMSGRGKILKGAALGAAGTGLAAGYLGADEGMQLDFIQNQLEAARKKQYLQSMGL
jgi:hypothetical protein